MNRMWVMGAAGLAGLALVGCKQGETAPKPPRPVKVQVVEEYGGGENVHYSAEIAPHEQVSVSFKVGGYVREVRQVAGSDSRMRKLQEGDRVTRGMVLARVEDSDYQQQVSQARAGLATSAAAQLKASLDFERAKKLFDSQSLTKPDYDGAKANFETTTAQEEGARAQLELAESALRDTALKAPLDGVILSRNIEVGTLVSPGTTGFVIADTSAVKAVFGVPDLLVKQARQGMKFAATTESYGMKQFPGQITAIAPNADTSSRVFQVELTIPNPRNQLKPGMIATVAIPESVLTGMSAAGKALVVPLNSIVKSGTGEGYAVFVVEQTNGKPVARRRAVSVGEVYGNRITITEGLKLNEQVIVSGATLVTDGELLQIIP